MASAVETQCPVCEGEGAVEHPFLEGAYGGSHAECPPSPALVECEDCRGSGKVDDEQGDDASTPAPSDLLALVYQYRDDLIYPPSVDSRERRLAAIDAALAAGPLA